MRLQNHIYATFIIFFTVTLPQINTHLHTHDKTSYELGHQ